MRVHLALALALLCGFYAFGFSQGTSRPIEIDLGNVVIKGHQHLNSDGTANDKGEPVLLVHGLTSNEHEFNEYVSELLQAGFNPFSFNFRGHGNAEERSYVKNYHEGDYRFEHLVRADFPAMVEKVHELTGKRVRVIGHSMGAMVSLAANGLGFDNGLIVSIIAVGGPPHFREHTLALRFFQRMVRGLLYSRMAPEIFYEIMTEEKSPLRNISDGTKEALFRSYEQYVLRHPVVNWFARGLLNAHNFEQKEIASAARTAISPVHRDILCSFNDFFVKGYPYEGLMVSVPVLYVYGDYDNLAPPEAIIKTARLQARHVPYGILGLKGVSHLDEAAAPVVRGYAQIAIDFLNNPGSFGPPGTHRRTAPLAKCADVLTSFSYSAVMQ